ncbi:helix-turn-helix domain-containing protein [Mycetohabitans sp. B8]|nr:helix-turn-helix domain-containing protein [Mycetohabitans sp. B8]
MGLWYTRRGRCHPAECNARVRGGATERLSPLPRPPAKPIPDGETPHRYLRRLHLDIALQLLGDPSRSLVDIALSVGFANQSAFTHVFTTRFDVAPGRCRRA